MALTVGSCAVDTLGNVTGSGLSADLANAFRTALSTPQVSKNLSDVMTPFIGVLCTQLAVAIIGHIQANASVTMTIRTTDGGLQTSAAAGNPTTGPAANKTVANGSIS